MKHPRKRLWALVTSISLFLILTSCNIQDFLPFLSSEQIEYGDSLPEGTAVDNAWFDNSAFIGHSLIQGLSIYGEWNEPDYYYLVGASVASLLSSHSVSLPNGRTGSLADELVQHNYDRVYLMMGINEITGNLDTLKSDFQSLLNLVYDSQPNAEIYIISVIPVTQSKSNEGTFTLSRILSYNDMLLDLCTEQSCWYVNLYEQFANEDGYLPASISTDGVHLTPEQYPIMRDYFYTHTAK